MQSLPADLRDLVAEVISQTPRLLALQDRDPDSPTRGCMHPAYWRDKTSDVADMRRQEAALTFAWLWRHEFPGNPYREDRELLHASLRALGFWTRMQHRDGTFDEWYRGEHGYATTAFSTYAVALAAGALGDGLAGPLREGVLRGLRRSGDWLTRHHDWFKTNHEAVGVAALGAVGKLLDDERLRGIATRNASMIERRMDEEGWSREISGTDVGYTFLLAEYLGMHAVLNGERSVLPAVLRAYRFAVDFLHPDLTTGAEYGICGNPYFSRVATVIAAPHDPLAAGVLQWMDRPVPAPRDTSATLRDDLRLARYSYQPLLAALLHRRILSREDLDPEAAADPEPEAPLFRRTDDRRWHPRAKLAAFARPGYAAWAAPCFGGFLRVAFRCGDGFGRAVADRGFAVEHRSRTHRNARYGLDASAESTDDEIRVRATLSPCRFVLPPYWARAGLRVATSLPYGPRWSRWLIDRWRARRGTALNQSAAGIAAGHGPFRMDRTMRFHPDRVEVTDRLWSSAGPLDPDAVFAVLDGPVRTEDGERPDIDRRIPIAGRIASAAGAALTVRKEFRFDGNEPIVRFLG